ncbi:hypothetical protein SAMN02799626_01508 [Caulobacter sp. UNC279MFTsu5.1]|nr:hypothetical protein SAMN02799626_01508 [Caulobacter sp. UNC279MFTsu5.1]
MKITVRDTERFEAPHTQDQPKPIDYRRLASVVFTDNRGQPRFERQIEGLAPSPERSEVLDPQR